MTSAAEGSDYGENLTRIFENVHKCEEFVSNLVTPMQELMQKYNAELEEQLDQVRRTRQAQSESEEKRVKELKKQHEALTKSVEMIKKENESLEQRLEEQGKETAQRFGFHFEPADARKKIEKQYKDLFEHAIKASEQIAIEGKREAEEDKKRNLPAIVSCLNAMFNIIHQAATKSYTQLQQKLNILVQEIGLNAENLSTNSEILSHIIRHTATCAHPELAVRGAMPTPKKFTQEALVTWEDLRKSSEYQTIQTYVNRKKLQDVDATLKSFVEMCCDFCWQWLMFQGRGQMISSPTSSEHFQWLPGYQSTSAKKHVVWSALVDHQSVLIHKGYVASC